VSWYLSLAGHFGIPLAEDLNRDIDSNLHYVYPWSEYQFSSTQNVVEQASGIQLFSETFNHKVGYTILNRLNVNVVLYRFDRLAELESYIQENIDDRFIMKNERANLDQSVPLDH
jgi:hypothetical protein